MINKTDEFIKAKRKNLGLSQVDLVLRSGVSLPTIQNIEAGKANPSVAVLEKVLGVFGYGIRFAPVEPDWQELAGYGLPLQQDISPADPGSITGHGFLYLLEKTSEFFWYHSTDPKYSRHRDAFKAMLLALKTHYPGIFSRIKHPFALALSREIVSGRDIKLRNISLERISECY